VPSYSEDPEKPPYGYGMQMNIIDKKQMMMDANQKSHSEEFNRHK